MAYNGKYDFCGWATKNNLRCSDGRVIRHGAFRVNDGKKVPLVWNHEHNDPSKVLGHAILENRDEGVYAYGLFNETSAGKDAKESVAHGDVVSMSIWANDLDQIGNDVMHGNIREVSLVLAGANPGAFVESVMAHGEPMDETDMEGIFYTGDEILAHSDSNIEKVNKDTDQNKSEKDSDKKTGKTVKDVYDAMTDDQKKVVAIISNEMVKEATSGKKNDPDNEEEKEMKHNVFSDGNETRSAVLSHSDMEKLLDDAKRVGSLRAAVKDSLTNGGVLAHALDTTGMDTATGTQTYGFNDPSMLFPEYHNLNNPPEFISREMGWVKKVMDSVHRSPMSRIKSTYANITEDEARAKGYIKGTQKKTEVFTTLKRVTAPTTVYKLQKIDRDDIIDITDFDVIAWIKSEMRVMLDEEIARAILIGDGRQSDSEYKIKEDCVRPVVTDVPLFNTKVLVKYSSNASDDDRAKAIIRAAIKARKNYKGSGKPIFWTTEDVLTDMLLLEDQVGHMLYKTEGELATALRVSEIVTVEPMEGQTVDSKNLLGTIVNLTDYNVGADKGGKVNMFDDFDLDFNKYEYLIETRISGALVKPFAALTLLEDITA